MISAFGGNAPNSTYAGPPLSAGRQCIWKVMVRVQGGPHPTRASSAPLTYSQKWDCIHNLGVVLPNPYVPKRIRMLISGDIFGLCCKSACMKGRDS